MTTEVRDATGRLADAGIPLGNQSVLLKGVNDDVTVMRALVQKLKAEQDAKDQHGKAE